MTDIPEPPKFWLPSRPAIIRAARDIKPPKLGMLPGITPVVAAGKQDIFVTNFSEYSVNDQPPDWTAPWSNSGFTALVQSVAGSISGKALRWTKTIVTRQGLRWNRVPNAADCEILFRARAIEAYAANDIFIFALARGSGAITDETGYRAGVYGITTSTLYGQYITKFVSGTATNVGSAFSGASPNYAFNQWFWFRFRLSGINLSGKLWKDGQAEPGSFVNSTTDNSITDAGWIGLFSTGTNPDVEVDFFSVALRGKNAPGP